LHRSGFNLIGLAIVLRLTSISNLCVIPIRSIDTYRRWLLVTEAVNVSAMPRGPAAPPARQAVNAAVRDYRGNSGIDIHDAGHMEALGHGR
jgi:hypothetical protein